MGLTDSQEQVRAPLVLVVDDDDDGRELMMCVLEHEGYRVHGAHNGRVALAMVAERQPDVIVLDLMMPIMNGWEVLLALQERPELASIPVVVASAALEPVRGNLGPVRFLAKPLQLETFLETVRGCFEPRVTNGVTERRAV